MANEKITKYPIRDALLNEKHLMTRTSSKCYVFYAYVSLWEQIPQTAETPPLLWQG